MIDDLVLGRVARSVAFPALNTRLPATVAVPVVIVTLLTRLLGLPLAPALRLRLPPTESVPAATARVRVAEPFGAEIVTSPPVVSELVAAARVTVCERAFAELPIVSELATAA